jgi:hypothetical protein
VALGRAVAPGRTAIAKHPDAPDTGRWARGDDAPRPCTLGAAWTETGWTRRGSSMAQATSQINPTTAAEFLRDLGFLLVPDEPELAAPSYLLVAIRARPTEQHYDPETITFWETVGPRGVPAAIDHTTRMPWETTFSWGQINVIDRFGITNEYLSFGGDLSAASIDDMTVSVFFSPAPMLRRGGHSQGWDLVAPNLGAFFGRLKAAVGVHSLEAQATEAGPLARYCGFVMDYMSRHRTSEDLQRIDAVVWSWLRSEEARLRRTEPAAWARGQALVAAAVALHGVAPAEGEARATAMTPRA